MISKPSRQHRVPFGPIEDHKYSINGAIELFYKILSKNGSNCLTLGGAKLQMSSNFIARLGMMREIHL